MSSSKANNWSSETSSTYFKDLQATVLALRCTGEHLLLGGRRYLAVLNIDGPPQVLKKMPRQGKFDLTAAEWNPHLSHSHYCAVACNQRPEIYTWEREQLIPNHTLKQHTRTVTGLAWHRFEPTLLATCSVDTYVHIWDLREPRKPSSSFQSIVGASQIQWNKVQGNVFATTQDNVIQIWDQRKTNLPVQYITGHLSKIYCLDWSPTSENHIMTASMDASAKIFDITAARQYERIIETGAPVWKAKYTPFSDAVITLSIQKMKRGETKMDLWSTADSKQSVHSFIGLSDSVYDFALGKVTGKGVRDHQLICWCKDQTLKTWVIDSQVKSACGYESSDTDVVESEPDVDGPIEIMCNHEALEAELDSACQELDDVDMKDVELAPEAESYEPKTSASSVPVSLSLTPLLVRTRISERDLGSPSFAQPKTTLQQEFSLINSSISENLQIDELDSVNRVCQVRASSCSGKRQVVLQIQFPVSYPYSAPTFQFCQGTTEDVALRQRILKGMREVVSQKMKRNLPCLEPCLRNLGPILDQSTGTDSDQIVIRSSLTLEDLDNVSVGRRDMSVPYPRSSGARFCSAGMLVCFGRPSYSKRISSNSATELKTPRSLSTKPDCVKRAPSLESQYGLKFPMPPVAQSPTGDPSASISYFYYQDRRSKTRTKFRLPTDEKKPDDNSNKKKVTIYDASRLMPLQKDLAAKYVINEKNIAASCLNNAQAAALFGRRDLVNIWTLAATITSPSLVANKNADAGTPWAQQPGGRKLVHNLIDHCLKLYDIQTAAMLCCVFGTKTEIPSSYRVKTVSISSYNSSHSLKGRWGYKVGESAYHTVHPSDTTLEGWNYGSVVKHSRSNSWSESFDEIKPLVPAQNFSGTMDQHEKNCKLLDPDRASSCDSIRRVYADILYRWEMPEYRSQVLKYQSTSAETHSGIDFFIECPTCKFILKDGICKRCNKTALSCAVCNIGVRGASVFCLVCCHGGHPNHIKEWFSEFDVCPKGCGCECKAESPSVVCP